MKQENKCLFCYKEILLPEQKSLAGQSQYHEKCSRLIFGKKNPPTINFSKKDIASLAEKIVRSQQTVTGVQPKLSLGLEKTKGKLSNERFTIVGGWGDYILKPQTERYPNLPEIEDLTMSLAKTCKIKTVKHSLIRLKSGELAYITKRVDRVKGKKLHMEDMCQLTERLTEHKYKGSYEQIAKTIKKFVLAPGLDVINFYELVLFSFLTGNNDMHLKNFSLLKTNNVGYSLCPAYDLVASELVVEDDDEELALNLNGKKRRLKRRDFEAAMKNAGINDKSIENIFKKFEKSIPNWSDLIEISFLPAELKEVYQNLVLSKAKQIEIFK